MEQAKRIQERIKSDEWSGYSCTARKQLNNEYERRFYLTVRESNIAVETNGPESIERVASSLTEKPEVWFQSCLFYKTAFQIRRHTDGKITKPGIHNEKIKGEYIAEEDHEKWESQRDEYFEESDELYRRRSIAENFQNKSMGDKQ